MSQTMSQIQRATTDEAAEKYRNARAGTPESAYTPEEFTAVSRLIPIARQYARYDASTPELFAAAAMYDAARVITETAHARAMK